MSFKFDFDGEMRIGLNGVEVKISESAEGIFIGFETTEQQEAVLIVSGVGIIKKRTRIALKCFNHSDALRRWETHTAPAYTKDVKIFKITDKGLMRLKIK